MRLSSVLLAFAAAIALPTVGSGQNGAPAGGNSPAGSQSAPAERPMTPSVKRPMTFDDMMAMKRLGDTAVSPDGKWLAYSVTSVDLEKNTKTAELWLQAIAGPSDQSSAPFKLGVGQPGDSGVQFAPDGKRILFISGRTGANQIWLADFDAATGATTHLHKLTNLDLGIENAKWSPDSKSIVFTAPVYPDCPAIVPDDNGAGAECNYDRDAKAADSKVKAQIFTQLLYRHWNHYTGDKRSHLFLVSVETGAMRDLNPGDVHDVPPFSLEGVGCGCDISPDGKELAFTENVDAVPALSTSVSIFTLDLTNSAAKPVKVSTSAGGNFDPAYSPDGKWLAWRSQARAGYESDKFRLVLIERGGKSASQQVSESAGRETRATAGQETGATKGGPTVRDLLPKFDNWVDEFAWGASSKQIAFVSGVRGEEDIYLTGPGSEAAGQITRTGEFSNLHLLARTDHPGAVERGGIGAVIATMMRVNQPPEVALVSIGDTPEDVTDQPGVSDFDDSPIRVVTHLNDALLAQLDLPKMESFWFAAADKTKLEGFLIRPPGFDATK